MSIEDDKALADMRDELAHFVADVVKSDPKHVSALAAAVGQEARRSLDGLSVQIDAQVRTEIEALTANTSDLAKVIAAQVNADRLGAAIADHLTNRLQLKASFRADQIETLRQVAAAASMPSVEIALRSPRRETRLWFLGAAVVAITLAGALVGAAYVTSRPEQLAPVADPNAVANDRQTSVAPTPETSQSVRTSEDGWQNLLARANPQQRSQLCGGPQDCTYAQARGAWITKEETRLQGVAALRSLLRETQSCLVEDKSMPQAGDFIACTLTLVDES